MATHGYKKYMKKDVQDNSSLVKIFVISFFGMLLVFTFLIKSFSPTVDTSIGGDKETIAEDVNETGVDERLHMIQSEDQGKNFTDLIAAAQEKQRENTVSDVVEESKPALTKSVEKSNTELPPPQDTVYKVYIGTYTSAEQAKVAKDIIQESGAGLNPIVKCIGSNNYTLQVGIFKSKQSAESMLYSVQQNHLPGRVVQE